MIQLYFLLFLVVIGRQHKQQNAPGVVVLQAQKAKNLQKNAPTEAIVLFKAHKAENKQKKVPNVHDAKNKHKKNAPGVVVL